MSPFYGYGNTYLTANKAIFQTKKDLPHRKK